MRITQTNYDINGNVLGARDLTDVSLSSLEKIYASKSMQFSTYFKDGVEKQVKLYEMKYDIQDGTLEITFDIKNTRKPGDLGIKTTIYKLYNN